MVIITVEGPAPPRWRRQCPLKFVRGHRRRRRAGTFSFASACGLLACLPPGRSRGFETRYDSGGGRSPPPRKIAARLSEFCHSDVVCRRRFFEVCLSRDDPSRAALLSLLWRRRGGKSDCRGRDFSNRDLQMDRSGTAKTTVANRRRWPWEHSCH